MRDLTQFEREVYLALGDRVDHDLAVRVAAAIDEIAREYAEDVSAERGNLTKPGDEQPLWNSLRQDALKKLRGDQ